MNIDVWCRPPTVVGLFFSTMDDDNNGTRLLSSYWWGLIVHAMIINHVWHDVSSPPVLANASSNPRIYIGKNESEPRFIIQHGHIIDVTKSVNSFSFFKYFPPSLSARLSNDTNLMSRPRCPLVPFGLPPPVHKYCTYHYHNNNMDFRHLRHSTREFVNIYSRPYTISSTAYVTINIQKNRYHTPSCRAFCRLGFSPSLPRW